MKNKKALYIVISIILVMLLVFGLLVYEICSLAGDSNINLPEISFQDINLPDISSFGNSRKKYYKKLFKSLDTLSDQNRTIGTVHYALTGTLQEEKNLGDGHKEQTFIINEDDENYKMTMVVGIYKETNVQMKLEDEEEIHLNQYQKIISDLSLDVNCTYQTDDDFREYYQYLSYSYEEDGVRYCKMLTMYCYDNNHMIYFDLSVPVYKNEDCLNFGDGFSGNHFNDLIESVE